MYCTINCPVQVRTVHLLHNMQCLFLYYELSQYRGQQSVLLHNVQCLFLYYKMSSTAAYSPFIAQGAEQNFFIINCPIQGCTVHLLHKVQCLFLYYKLFSTGNVQCLFCTINCPVQWRTVHLLHTVQCYKLSSTGMYYPFIQSHRFPLVTFCFPAY